MSSYGSAGHTPWRLQEKETIIDNGKIMDKKFIMQVEISSQARGKNESWNYIPPVQHQELSLPALSDLPIPGIKTDMVKLKYLLWGINAHWKLQL